MTPTQAQAIEIAKEHLRRSCMPDAQDTLAKIVALTAAAEAGEPSRDIGVYGQGYQLGFSTAIERCAQMAENWTDWHFGPDSSPNETIAAAIRALKDSK